MIAVQDHNTVVVCACIKPMKELIKLIEEIIGPENSWSKFARKFISVILTFSLGGVVWTEYQKIQRSGWEDLPLHTAINKGTIAKQVQDYLNRLLRMRTGELKSIWLYSWPDARTLIAVANAGDATNPLPLGYFQDSDAPQVGQLVMDQCTEIMRGNKNLVACPIVAENDSWGVIVFECHTPCTVQEIIQYKSFAHKLSHLIYYSNYD